jgi:CRP-like cAMP-binding protein
MRDAPRSLERETEPVPADVRPLGSDHVPGHRLRRLLKGSAYLAPTVAALVAGGAFAGTRGLVVAGLLIIVACVLIVFATPVVGFTCSQIALTNKGRKLATTVADVQSLKESDAAAFTKPFAAILRGLLTGQIDAAHTAPIPSEPGRELELKPPAPVDIWRDDATQTSVTSQSRSLGSAAPTFWQSLTTAEQEALEACAQRKTFLRGALLCRESEPAEFVFIISSGWTGIYVGPPGERRPIAIRSAGDIIGERAAFEVRSRSATVVAIEDVQTLMIPTADFAVFLEHYPRVIEVLERRVYDRLTEDRRSLLGEEFAVSGPWNGHICSILVVDITAFGRRDRNDDDRRTIRDAMYSILQEACENSNVPWLACHREDRGDGALIIVPPSTPTRSVVDPLLARLAAALKHHNRQATQATRFQLRIALHVGPVVSEPQGVSGEAIILASRIIEATKLKKELARTGAHLGVIVSAFVYDSVIKHAPGYVDPNQYHQLRFRVKESNLAAWMYLAA